METAIQSFKQYLHHVLGVNIEPKPWQEAERLPFYLRNEYYFHKARLLGTPFIIMEVRGSNEQGAAVVRKNLDQVFAQSNIFCVYLRSGISSYNRRRLIEQRVPFVVPGNQMYLPYLGIDLRDHFRKLMVDREKLSPATQAVVIYALVFGFDTQITPSHLSAKLGYTRMTMTRVLDELSAAKLGDVERKGRRRALLFSGGKRELWEKARPFMKSPVKKRFSLQNGQRLERLAVVAGLTALARYSMLNPPSRPVYALTTKAWNMLNRPGMELLPFPEQNSREVEVWRYKPELFAKEGVADPFSLYLSLQESQDERVAKALDDMMSQIQW